MDLIIYREDWKSIGLGISIRFDLWCYIPGDTGIEEWSSDIGLHHRGYWAKSDVNFSKENIGM